VDPGRGLTLVRQGARRVRLEGVSGLADTHPDMQRLARELEARCRAAGIPIVIASTTRTPAEQTALCRRGLSPLCGDTSAHVFGQAVDVAPLDSGGVPYWPPVGHSTWTRIGELAREVGLVWGGQWGDPSHVQLAGAQAEVNRRLARQRSSSALLVGGALAIGVAWWFGRRRRRH